VIGMGNSSEFACKGRDDQQGLRADPSSDGSRVDASGSSGGCAVAVAARLAPLALGTDGGGSSARPPAHVGVVGFKPSFGAIPDPIGFPHALSACRRSRRSRAASPTSRLMFESMLGADPATPVDRPVERVGAPARALRVAYSARLGLDVPVDDDVRTCIERAVDTLRRAGWTVADTDPAWPAGANEDALMPLQHIGLAGLFGDDWRRDPTRFDPDVARQIERGLQWSGADVARAREAGLKIALTLAEFLTRYDLLISPTTPCVAWRNDRLGPDTIGG
jgi:aspartyl-tRNA(Asn)/glutamyl-tRNA(Gln) amidotransferase subunit A